MVGLLHREVTVTVLCRRGGCVDDGLVFDGRQPAETCLSAPAGVSPFDPGDDRDPQLLAGGPRPAVEDVLLEEGEEAL